MKHGRPNVANCPTDLSSAGRLVAGAGTPAPADETPRRWRYTVVSRTPADHRFNNADPADERTPS